MIPTRRLAALAFGAAGVAAVAGFVPGVDAAWAALDLLLVALAGADVLALRGGRVTAERRIADILSVGRPNPVVITLTNRGARAIDGTVMDDPVDGAEASGLPGEVHLPPGASALLRYELTPARRGRSALGAVTVRYAGPLGLVARQERIEVAGARAVDVYPDVHAARALELLRRQGRAAAAVGSMRVRGGDTEFERLRPWQRGDEMRHVDWRASARHDGLVTRQFQVESNQNVVFALDVGRGMRGDVGGRPSIDQALAAALLTADVALRGGDRAGLLAFDDRPRSFLRPSGGRAGGRKLTRAVHALEAGLAATDYRSAMVFLETRVKARSLFVVFTNLLNPRAARDLLAAVRSLLPRHLPLCVLMRDPDVERLATAPIEREDDVMVRAAAAESIVWRDAIVHRLKSSGALVLDARPDEITPRLVHQYLKVKARRLL